MKIAILLAFASLGLSPSSMPGAFRAFEDPPQSQGAESKETEAERKLRKAKALLEAQGVRELQKRTLEKMIGTFSKMGLPDEFGERFVERFDIDEVVDMTAKIWAEQLDEPTLDGVIAFYRSDIGKTLSDKLPDITEASIEVGMKYGERIGREVGEELRGK